MPVTVWNLGLLASFQGLQAFTPIRAMIDFGDRCFRHPEIGPLAHGKP